mgnify:FL=1
MGVVQKIIGAVRSRFNSEMEQERLEILLQDLEDDICNKLGGESRYIESKPRTAYAKRNAEIREQFNGQNMRDICNSYNVSRARVYQIINE